MSGRMASWMEQIIAKELEYRGINNIIVPD
jgi:hypothetical protein